MAKNKQYTPDEILEMAVSKREKDLSADLDSDGKITSADARLASRVQSGLDAPGYNSKYEGISNALLDEIINREPFSYNMDVDAFYNQYKTQFTTLGEKAAENVMGKAASLTGGYGNSYAQTAASQAYNEYLSELADRVPELSKQAYSAYNDREKALYDKLEAVRKLEKDDYDEYRDSVDDYRYDVERKVDEEKNKVEFAFDAASRGDFSYLEALGVDTSKLKSDAASELAVLMAKYGDYSGLELLGIDTNLLKTEALTKYAAFMAKYGDYSGLRRIGVKADGLAGG